MQLPALITSDIHLTADASTEYRWALFPWLIEQSRRYKVRNILILGDITDAKDRHSAQLTNRVVKALTSLTEVAVVTVLAGNHDWLLQGQEFFRFLNGSAGGRLHFVTSPWEHVDVRGPSTFFLPYSKQPATDWDGLDFSHYDYVFLHQTVAGSIASNGQEMNGETLPDLSAAGKVYSGDIHVPQKIGVVEYVGSPYHVHFGDNFKPRVILLDAGAKASDLHMPSPRRISVTTRTLKDLRDLEITKGDQVKLRIEIEESDKHAWAAMRREAADYLGKQGAVAAAIEMKLLKSGARLGIGSGYNRRRPQEDVERFADLENLSGEMLDIGLDILENK